MAIQPITGNVTPNPAQFQQAINPIAEVGGNDLETRPDQRVNAAEDAQESLPAPPEGSGRGTVLDISV